MCWFFLLLNSCKGKTAGGKASTQWKGQNRLGRVGFRNHRDQSGGSVGGIEASSLDISPNSISYHLVTIRCTTCV